MKTGRNSPCPCGSGRKYKHCCLPADRAARNAAAVGLSDELQAAAREHAEWEADVFPLPAYVQGDDRSYMVATLVCAGPVVVGVEEAACHGAEPDQVAELIETAFRNAAGAAGAWPEALVVRDRAVARALEARFRAGSGPTGGDPPDVMAAAFLESLEPPARELVATVAGEDIWPPIAAVRTWAAWGLPEPDVAALFAAAATYHRAAPWALLDDVPPLFASWPDDEWTLAVLGSAGVEPGLMVYADEWDYDAALEAQSPEEAFAALGGWILGFSYGERNELPRPMQREVARSGWEVAAPDAYPQLMPIRTPGGGLSRRTVRRLADVLEAIAALVDREGDRLRAGEPAAVERTTGLRVEYPGEDRDAPDPYATVPVELHDLLDDLRAGRFASEDEVEAAVAARVRDHNASPNAGLSGLSPNQAQALLDGQWDDAGPLRLTDNLSLNDLAGADFLHNARTMLAAVGDGTVATQAGNLKRAFVAEMLERMRWPDGWLEMVRKGNKVINEEDAWLLHRLRVVLEVAGLLQRRKGRFRVTQRGRELLPDDAAGSLMAHLFRTYFRDFNIGYGGRGPDTGPLQYAVPLILARLPREAEDWVGRKALADRLLPPPTPAHGDPPGAGPGVLDRRDLDRIQLAVHVLDPLQAFGPLEQRGGGYPRAFGETELRVAPLFERLVSVQFG